MSEATYGERLAEARRIKGETIEEVAEQLRIRPSIILAMETSNFSHMPHKGYARNMVSSYARYLGLNSTALTEQFLREFRRWESSGNRSSISSNASTLALTTRRGAPDEPILASAHEDDNREMITAAKRNQSRSSVWGKENKRDTDRKFRSQLRQAQEDKSLRQSAELRQHRSSGRRVADENARQVRTNDYVGKPPRKSLFSGVSSGLSARPVLLIVGLVVVFIAILVLWAFLASTCAKNETSNVPVTGVTNTDNGLEEEDASSNVADIEAQIEEDNRYGPFELTVEVTEGESWLQVEVDGSTPVGEVCAAPWSQSYTVSSSAIVQAGAPGYVKVYRNGIEVELDTSSGAGYLELAVEERPIVQNAQDADETE